ncbi:MAG: hypothetical protein WBQ26_03375 [Gemmatimonadaceae bacterium]
MFGNDQTLRHLPFFEEVAAHEEHEGAWRAATAGLVTLRLVDQWIEEGAEVAARDSWGARAVLQAIDQMDEGSPIPSILRSVIAAMGHSRSADVHDVMPTLMAYGRALEYEAKWALAVDVYDTVVAHTHPVQESDAAIAAHQRRGFCLRTMGWLEQALKAYSASGAIAAEVGDMIGVLRARMGDAKIAVARGNLPQAEAMLDDTIARASEFKIPAIHALALHDRAVVAGLRGHHDVAIELAYEALRESIVPADRDRILSDIGTAFHMLGLRSVARDAFLVLSATAQEQYMRWVASLSLMGIAAEDGSEPIFEQFKSSLRPRTMPPELETEYYIRLGQAYHQLDRDDLGHIALAKAIQLAEHYGYFGLLFEAEEALHAAPVGRRVHPEDIPPPIADIAEAVRTMRVAALTLR